MSLKYGALQVAETALDDFLGERILGCSVTKFAPQLALKLIA